MEKKVNERVFSAQIEREISDRIEREIDSRLRADEKLQNELKWLKAELKKANHRDRLVKIERRFDIVYAVMMILGILILL
jgi:hypothetical protein